MNREERRRFVRNHRTCVFGYNRPERRWTRKRRPNCAASSFCP